MVAMCANVSKKMALFEMTDELITCWKRNKKNINFSIFAFEYVRKRVENQAVFTPRRALFQIKL